MTTTVLQGADITLVSTWFEFAGGPPVDLTGVTIAIESADGSTMVLAATSTGVAHPDEGVYTYIWDVPAGQNPGGYLITWSGTKPSGGTITATELVTVATVPTYAAQLANARRYDRVPYQATDAQGNPIPAAHFTCWDGVLGGNGANQVTNLTDLDGNPIPGGILVGDARGYAPGFLDLDKTPNLYIIGSETGVIPGVDPVLIEPSDTDDRVIALEAYVTGPLGLSDRQDALEASRGQPLGLATLGSDGRVSPEQLPGQLGGALGYAVTDYGALGDGSNDDSAAIQSVLNLVADTTPGARVVVPPGTYLLQSELEIRSSVWIELMPGATLKRGNASMQYMIRNFSATYGPTGYTGRGRIRITGGVWDAAGDTLTGSVTAIIIAHAKGVLIENVTVRNVRDWHAIEINSSQDVIVRGCKGEGFKVATSGREISETIQVDGAFTGGAIPGMAASGYDNTPCDNVLVEGCSARPYGSLGSFGRLVGSHSYVDNVFHTRIRVIGNYATGLGDYAVRAYNWWDAVVANNTFYSCNGAFMADVPTTPAAATVGHEGFTFVGNNCRSMGVQNGGTAVLDYAVRVEGIDSPSVPVREVIITGNVLKGIANAQAAIRCQNVADAVVSNNVIKDGTGTATRGINIVGCSNATITGNKISTVNGVGIHIYDGAVNTSGYPTVSGNTVKDTGDAGIHINSAEPTVTGNNVNGVNGGVAGLAIYNNASNAQVSGNKIRKGSGGTSGLIVRNACTLMGNTIQGWTTTASDTGASGQNVFVDTGGSLFPTTPRTYNKC